jgi:hypothetical protein
MLLDVHDASDLDSDVDDNNNNRNDDGIGNNYDANTQLSGKVLQKSFDL